MTDHITITRATRAMCRVLYGEDFDLHNEGSRDPDFRALLEEAVEAAIDAAAGGVSGTRGKETP